MTKLRMLGTAAIICGGTLILSGCQHNAAAPSGAAFPAPAPTLSAQAQIQQIESDPHIPAAQKPAIEAQITANNKNMNAAPSAPAKAP